MDDDSSIKEILDLFPFSGSFVHSPSYVYFGVILETFAKEKLVGDLWRYLAKTVPDEKDQEQVARRLREGLLKSSPLVGFPRGINGLAALRAAVQSTSPSVQKTLDADASLRAPIDKAARIDRGKAFFAKVYSMHTDRVTQNMALTSGGDLDEFAITGIYGDLMAESSILNDKETGLLEFSCCYASGAAPQAKGHAYGSRNLGNGKAEVLAVVNMCEKVAALVGVPLSEEGMDFVQEKVARWD